MIPTASSTRDVPVPLDATASGVDFFNPDHFLRLMFLPVTPGSNR